MAYSVALIYPPMNLLIYWLFSEEIVLWTISV